MATRKQRWMTDFNELVVTVQPYMSGRIDWDTAHHLRYQGYTAVDASIKYIVHMNESHKRLGCDGDGAIEWDDDLCRYLCSKCQRVMR